jgi:hypothetical protein
MRWLEQRPRLVLTLAVTLLTAAFLISWLVPDY